MKEKITIVEIAKMAGVSTATVSRVINNTGKVDENKRNKIRELIDRYNYKPNSIAKALQSSRSNMVGFVVPHINSPYYAQIFYETELVAQKQGYTLMLCNSESDKRLESNILNAFVASNVSAIVFMGGRLDDVNCEEKYLREIEEINKSIPVISCVNVPGLDCIQIYEEQEKSSDKLLKHLSKMGYEDVALVGGYSHVRTTIKRRKEILDNADKYGIKIRKEIIDGDYSVQGGNIAMQSMLKLGNLPQAIICINDLVATGVLSELNKNKLNVPNDIAISGYDNLDISQFIYPGITTISTNYKEYSKAIINAVQNADEISKNTKAAIQTDLIIRGTTQLQ